MCETVGVITLGRVARNIVLYRKSTKRIVSISWVYDILYQFHLIVGYSRICHMEVSLILRVLPCYIGCHYYLPFLFFEDGLSHPSTLSFPKGWHSHPSVAFIMWIDSASQTAYLHFCGLTQSPNCCLIS